MLSFFKAEKYREGIETAGIFLVSLVIFGVLQATNSFTDPDAFYHIKMSQLVWEHGPVVDFPWLARFTVLGNHFADQHLLYHILMAPFVVFLSPTIGAKIMTALLGAILVTVIHATLRTAKIAERNIWITILLVTSPWMFRMNLVKASSLAVLLGVIALNQIIREKPWGIFWVAILYPLTHAGFLVMVGLVGVAIAMRSLKFLKRHRFQGSFRKRLWLKTSFFLQETVSVSHLQMIVALIGGLSLGIVLHPSFPDNLFFTWQQFVQIGIVNYQETIRVGGEWYPYAVTQLLPNTIFVSLGLLSALVIAVITRKEQTPLTWTALMMTAIFFTATLKSRRYIEYEVVWAVMASASAWSDGMRTFGRNKIRKDLGLWIHRYRLWAGVLAVYVLVMIPGIVIRDTQRLYRDLESGQTVQDFAGAARYLKTSVPAKEILVHSDWDEFPLWFFHDDQHRYISGLDPTFMFLKNPDAHEIWVQITTGTFRGNLGRTMMTILHSRVAVVAKDHRAMMAIFDRSKDFDKVYEDSQAIIYRLNEP